MRHLITGGSGFLGSLIARRLARRGESVRTLDLWDDPGRPREVEFVPCDILDRRGVRKACEGIDVVHHNVALVPLTKAGGRFYKVNVEGSRIAAEEAAEAGVRTFIHMSSSAIFGAPAQVPITADTPPRPLEIYGKAKLAAELAVRGVCEAKGLALIVIRPRTILGEGRLGIFQILFEWIREGRAVYIMGRGDHPLQFIHAHDLIDAYMLALDADRPGIYNVGADRFGTLREALTNLIAHAGTRARIRCLPVGLTMGTLRLLDLLRLSPLAPYHYLTYHRPVVFDVRPLLEMGWKPRYSNDEMLRESYDWFCANYGRRAEAQAGSVHRRGVRQGVLWLLKKLS